MVVLRTTRIIASCRRLSDRAGWLPVIFLSRDTLRPNAVYAIGGSRRVRRIIPFQQLYAPNSCTYIRCYFENATYVSRNCQKMQRFARIIYKIFPGRNPQAPFSDGSFGCPGTHPIAYGAYQKILDPLRFMLRQISLSGRLSVCKNRHLCQNG